MTWCKHFWNNIVKLLIAEHWHLNPLSANLSWDNLYYLPIVLWQLYYWALDVTNIDLWAYKFAHSAIDYPDVSTIFSAYGVVGWRASPRIIGGSMTCPAIATYDPRNLFLRTTLARPLPSALAGKKNKTHYGYVNKLVPMGILSRKIIFI